MRRRHCLVYSRCPVCKKSQLYIFDDFAYSSQWSFCPRCNAGSDILGLAERTWNVDPQGAIAKIKASGISVGTPDRPLDRLSLVKATEDGLKFWDDVSSRSLAGSPDATSMVQEFNWRCRVPSERRMETVGSLYGWASKSEIDRFRTEDSSHSYDMYNWGDAMVLKFEDLPGRPCGFLAIGKNKSGEVEKYYKAIRTGHGGYIKTEAGLCMHPMAITAARRWSRCVIAIRDAELAIRLQCSHLERDISPLPIVIWHSGRYGTTRHTLETEKGWIQLYRRYIHFWMPKPCGTTMAQAIRQNGLVSRLVPVGGMDWDEFLGFRSPSDIAAMVINASEPWRKVMIELLAELDDQAAREFLVEIKESGISPESLDLPSQTKTLIDCLTGGKSRVRMVTHGGTTIMVQDDSWYQIAGSHRPELVMNASLEITHAIHQPHEGRILYKGSIGYQGEKIDFTAPDSEVEKRSMTFVRKTLLEKRKGIITFPSRLDTSSFHIASQLSECKYITGLDRVGWDEDVRKFVFPSFSISAGGAVDRHDIDLFLEGSPCPSWEPPLGLSGADIELVSNSGSLAWAVTVALISSLVAPATHGRHKATSIGVRGIGAMQAARRAVESYQGNFISVHGGSYSANIVNKTASRHGCLSYVENPPAEGGGGRGSNSSFVKWLASNSPNAFVPLTPWQSLAKKLDLDWIILEAQQPEVIDQMVLEAMSVVITNYICRFCKNHFELPESESLVEAVLQDLGDFISDISGSSYESSAKWAISHFDGYSISDRAKAFADCLSNFVLENDFKFTTELTNKSRKAIVSNGRELFVPKRTFCNSMDENSGVMPKHSTITDILSEDKKLVGETESCWIVDSEWWINQHKKHTDTDNRMLRIIG
jgi:hypothetical protein